MHPTARTSSAATLALAASAALVLLGAGCAPRTAAPPAAPAPTFEEPAAVPPLPLTPAAPPDAADAVPPIPLPIVPNTNAPVTAPPIPLPPIATPAPNADAENPSPRPSRTIVITAKSWAFEPAEIRITKDETVTLEVTSVDVAHGFFIPALGINEQLEPGTTVRVELQPKEAGTFPMICNVYCGAGHRDMRGTIIVE